MFSLLVFESSSKVYLPDDCLIIMAKEKRTKPCFNCKKSKVKCIYTNTLPCERCIKSGQALSCHFVPKLPSLKLTQVPPGHESQESVMRNKSGGGNVGIMVEKDMSLPPINPLTRLPPASSNILPSNYVGYSQDRNSHGVQILPNLMPDAGDSSYVLWKNQIESSISMLDSKLGDLANLIRNNQQSLGNSRNDHDVEARYRSSNAVVTPRNNSPNTTALVSPQSAAESTGYESDSSKTLPGTRKRKLTSAHDEDSKKSKSLNSDEYEYNRNPDDFRKGFLTIDQAKDLFKFFVTHISPQLFGFEISKFNVDTIWQNSPILICAICAIASIHHPDEALRAKLHLLNKYLHTLCSNLLYQGRPRSYIEGFNSIVALVLCSFWLSNAQMFTGLAFQLAKEIGLNKPNSKAGGFSKNEVSEKDRLKLWYLLYILDGQQSLTFSRQPVIDSQDYTLKNSRKMLLEEKSSIAPAENKKTITNAEDTNDNANNKVSKSNFYEESLRKEQFTDMCLVSQVEYNQALDEAFKGDAWDLLAPLSFGIPSKTNLELDRWMVSWAVLLSPFSSGAVWSSKSTLIYYNFAKMHINSSAVRQLQMESSNDSDMFPKWNKKVLTSHRPQSPRTEVHVDDDGADDDEFLSNKEIISEDEATVSASIAINAARTVLNSVLNDQDILNNLKYVPVHIHLMLYYAALLLINHPLVSSDKNIQFSDEEYFTKVVDNLKTVKNLQGKIYQNSPTDIQFGKRFINSLDDLIQEKAMKIRKEILENTTVNPAVKRKLENDIQLILKIHPLENSLGFASFSDFESRSTSPDKIAAWPGSNHGHP